MQTPFRLGSRIGRTIVHTGREFMFFSGTAYLGMGDVLEFGDKLEEGIKKYGISHGLSRVNNVSLDIYERFELSFAQAAGANSACVWSSGFLAGLTTVQLLQEQHSQVWVAPRTHPAVMGQDLVAEDFPDRLTWETSCMERAASLPASKVLIISNSVDVLRPEVYGFDWVRRLPVHHSYTLLIDDSHGFGVLGEGIFGTYSLWKDLPVSLVVSGSLGKGLQIPAGIVLGPDQVLSEIRKTAVFRGASPPPPAYLYAFLESIGLYKMMRDRLKTNMQTFQSLLEGTKDLTFDPGFPVFTFEDQSWVQQLEAAGIVVSSFPYPRPQDPCTNRIVLSAAHLESDLNSLIHVLNKIRTESKRPH